MEAVTRARTAWWTCLAACAAALGCSESSTAVAPTEGNDAAIGFDLVSPLDDAALDDVAPIDGNAPVDVGAPMDVGAAVDVGPRCGDGRRDPGEQCDDGNADAFDGCRPDCTRPVAIAPPDRTWTWYPIPGTQCLDGRGTGVGVSTVAGSTDLVFYLEGGGACFNDVCDVTALNVPFVPPPDGIFNRNNTANPVRGWNMVYVPYCTGDIYAGDRDTMLGGSLRHFHGYRNIERDLEAVVPAFPKVNRVLWTGISAGGFGAGLTAPMAFRAFGPSRRAILIDDSGPPFGNDVIAPCLQQIFRDVWGLDGTFLAECGADCPNPNDFALGAITHLQRLYPDATVGLFSNTGDTVIRTFMGFGWGNGRANNCAGLPIIVPTRAYTDGLLALRARFGSRASFFFNGPTGSGFGLGHTTLRGPSFYTTSVGGVTVAQWVGDVIAGRVRQVGP
jgi:cysteine-rich repeat protein